MLECWWCKVINLYWWWRSAGSQTREYHPPRVLWYFLQNCVWASADFWGLWGLFCQVPLVSSTSEGYTASQPMFQPSHTAEQRPQKESIDQIQASQVAQGWEELWLQVTSNVNLFLHKWHYFELPIDRAASIPFDSKILSLSVTSKSSLVRLFVWKLVCLVRCSMPAAAWEHQCCWLRKWDLFIYTGQQLAWKLTHLPLQCFPVVFEVNEEEDG